MKKEVTAIFDIGKTNKKFFLFDKNFREVHREYIVFNEIEDEDGHPTENINLLCNWIKNTFDKTLKDENFHVKSLNFSAYGASFVHIDGKGDIVAPLYNYTKACDKGLEDEFYKKYGPEKELTRTSGSLRSAMLNSGLQLYWLKHAKPEVFNSIRYALHLPQYLSYMYTGIPLSDYTSIGCHTALWNYEIQDYQDWVYEEGIDVKLAPIVSTETSINLNYKGRRLRIGVGIHDSSSALLPYIKSAEKPFVLLSTGTWSIALNPFSSGPLSENDVRNECINYMRIDGKPVKSSRMFLGNEYKIQVKKLNEKFDVNDDYHKSISFNERIYSAIIDRFEFKFKFLFLAHKRMPQETEYKFDGFNEAYHQLMVELAILQVDKLKVVMNPIEGRQLFIDGGFSENEVFINSLHRFLPGVDLKTTKAALGSALGSVLVVSDKNPDSRILEDDYALKNIGFSR